MRSTLLIVLLAACSTLSPADPHAFAKPPAPATPISVCWLETGGATVSGGFAAGGSTTLATWEITSSALLVRHPHGDVLIDTGISPDMKAEADELGGFRHFIFNQTAGRNHPRGTLNDLLAALGVTHLKGVVLSHAHPDHAGGVSTLWADVPVWMGAPEVELVRSELEHPRGVVVPAQARALRERMSPIVFEATPYALSDEQWDVFGDGSIVVVPTFGHTPGSVATFINLSPTQRIMHVGDLINVGESLERHVGKSWLMRTLTDEDEGRTEAAVKMVIALHQQDPELTILPAHDRPAHEALFGPQVAGLSPCISSK